MDGEVVGTCSANKPVIGDGCLDKEIQRKSGAVDLHLGCRYPVYLSCSTLHTFESGLDPEVVPCVDMSR